MKKALQLVLIAALASMMTGCASTGGYFADRGRDASDILTATVGVGAGAKARVGPIQVGLLANMDMIGLRGGNAGPVWWYETETRETLAPFPYRARRFAFTQYPWTVPSYVFGYERYHAGQNDADPIVARGKSYEAVSPLPLVVLSDQPEFYTQCEVTIALLGSVRLGFNPGELLDFILGWTTIDIYNDDIERKKSNKILEDTGTSAPDPQD